MQDNTIRLPELNISDVRDAIQDTSDENLLELTAQIAADLNGTNEISPVLLIKLILQLMVFIATNRGRKCSGEYVHETLYKRHKGSV